MSEIYKIDLNIVKIKQILAEIAREQATREFSGTTWLEKIYKELDKIDEQITLSQSNNPTGE